MIVYTGRMTAPPQNVAPKPVTTTKLLRTPSPLVGFSIIEVLIVIAIIGLLAGIILVVVGSTRLKAEQANNVNYSGQIKRAIIADCVSGFDFTTATASGSPAICGGLPATFLAAGSDIQVVTGAGNTGKAMKVQTANGYAEVQNIPALGQKWTVATLVTPVSGASRNIICIGNQTSTAPCTDAPTRLIKITSTLSSPGNVTVSLYHPSTGTVALSTTTNPVKDNIWNSLAISGDGTKATLIVNGQLLDQKSFNGTYDFPMRAHIGRGNLNAIIDDVIIANAALGTKLQLPTLPSPSGSP